MSRRMKEFVDMKVQARQVLMFAKSTDPDSHRAKEIFEHYLAQDQYEIVDIEKREDCKRMEDYFRFLCLIDHRKSPYIFIDHLYFGSLFELNNCHRNGTLKEVFA